MLLTDSSRYGCTSLSYHWSLCLCRLSAVKFALPLILLTADHRHICISVVHVQLWAPPDKPGVDHSLEMIRRKSKERRGGPAVENGVCFLPQYPSSMRFFPSLYVSPVGQPDELHRRSGCGRCLPDWVASLRKETVPAELFIDSIEMCLWSGASLSHPSGAYLSVISADRAQTPVVFLSAIVITL